LYHENRFTINRIAARAAAGTGFAARFGYACCSPEAAGRTESEG
jgi:hypothetical protein